jgi:hypothetical protein
MQRFGSMVYMAFGCQGYMAVTAYNIELDEFKVSYLGDMAINKLTFTSTQSFFSYTMDNNNDGRGFLKRGPVHSPNSMYNLELGGLNMIRPSATKNFVITQNETILDVEIKVWVGESDEIPAEDPEMTKQLLFNSTSDVEFFLSPIDLGTKLNNNEYEFDVNFTCSRNGDTKIKYYFDNFTNAEIPDWVKINPKKNKLTLKPPYLASRQNYNLTIKAEIEGRRRTFSKFINFGVRP